MRNVVGLLCLLVMVLGFLCVFICWLPMAAWDAIVTVVNKKFAELFDALW